MYLGWAWAKAELTPPDTITTARIKVENRVICSLAIAEPGANEKLIPARIAPEVKQAAGTETALLPAPFWCTYAWNRPTSTGAGGSDPLWLCWRGKPSSRSAGEATPHQSGVNWNDN